MANVTNLIPYPQTALSADAVCTAAKTTEGDLTNAVLLYTAPANAPALVTRLTANPRATVTASRLKVYLCRAAAPTAPFFVRERLMGARTVNETSVGTDVDFGYTNEAPLKLGAGDLLYVATGVALAGGIVFHAEIEPFEAA